MTTEPLDTALYQHGTYPYFIHHPDAPPANCADTDPEIFFPPQGGSAEPAKRICNRCGLLDQCRTWALAQSVDDLLGVWGGTSWYERRRIHGRQ